MIGRIARGALLVPVVALLAMTGCNGEPADDDAPEAAVEFPVDEATAGHVEGRVVFEGEPPGLPTIDMAAEPDCQDRHDTPPRSRAVVVNENGTLKNVFVYVTEGLDPGLEFPVPQEEVEIDQYGCLYLPRTVGIQAGQTLALRNSDGLLHNINAQPSVNRGFNISQPVDMVTNRTFQQPEVMIPLRCDVHGWMSAFVGVQDHPYHAATREEGTFRLETLPPGDYVLEAWHERYGVLEAEVTVATGETTEVEFTYSEAMAENAVVPMADPIDPHDHHGEHHAMPVGVDQQP